MDFSLVSVDRLQRDVLLRLGHRTGTGRHHEGHDHQAYSNGHLEGLDHRTDSGRYRGRLDRLEDGCRWLSRRTSFLDEPQRTSEFTFTLDWHQSVCFRGGLDTGKEPADILTDLTIGRAPTGINFGSIAG